MFAALVLPQLLHRWRENYWALLPSNTLARSLVSALLMFAAIFFAAAFFEKRAGASLKRYLSRGFFNDLLYGLFYQGGVYSLFIYQPWLNSLRPTLAVIDVNLLGSLPAYVSLPVYFLIVDLMGYLLHRLYHTRWLWPFHSVHHSQENMTYLTSFRFHIVEQFLSNSAAIIPMLLLGAPAKVWLPVTVFGWMLQMSQHSELDWRMGPFYRVFAGPVFHSIHHSTDPAYFNKNFGMMFSFWDFLFGTAVDAPVRCRVYGVTGLEMPETVRGQFATPFRAVYRQILPAPAAERRTRPSKQ
jgi:sterol desaturase/sphingolipid hydroxylase (fatty acid hydroxylase superfamily)